MDAEDEEKLLEYVFRAMKALERIAEAVEAKPSLQGQPSLTYPVVELAPGFVRAPVKFDESIDEHYYGLSKGAGR
jgi:hypothetical protein